MARLGTMALAAALGGAGAAAGGAPPGPAQGFDIHVMAPHVVEGMVMGPFHHYCKLAQERPLVLECLLYGSSDPKARLVGVEYFIDQELTRPNLRLDVWNEFYHDHAVEIASGRVAILDRPEAEAKALAEAAARTDGIIWKLWMDGQPVPNGRAIPAQSVGHRHRREGPGPPAPGPSARRGAPGAEDASLAGAFCASGTAPARDPLLPRVPPGELASARRTRNPLPASAEQLARGREVYHGKGACAACHGRDGAGLGADVDRAGLRGALPRDFTDRDWQAARTDGELFWVMRRGSPGTAMASFVPGVLSEEETWQALLYVRALGR
jgi:mono/diheme cytochrome c family protein